MNISIKLEESPNKFTDKLFLIMFIMMMLMFVMMMLMFIMTMLVFIMMII